MSTEYIPKDMADYGQRLIALGQAMTNPNTTIAELVVLGRFAGLDIRFGIQPREPEEAQEISAPSDENDNYRAALERAKELILARAGCHPEFSEAHQELAIVAEQITLVMEGKHDVP